ncbi:MAG: monophosphatase, myo-inositol-1(or 4)-monophosphatase [Candidatus Peregrinibacteria bacterium GW2011_GWF2_33_10]|nr:MAG: monophosphatase, myo-inositol-1(or 4)-monophosphatase [Candidatus Peregrinibacteria bacterium GW2011_GWF2_33_10]OGJ45751.1 MAG: hypothetical protein A2263_01085 [Candidatus Peregrinibacteria bacterium RIFOXYA2_FULL_33_21]OGJ46811.1 MAG: hypothetical protein A2272_00685 [Candidatus Peregrinibacteria bacterium RIFOXYA12_FULL_33_12]OGJ51281.1 MAG: hypothetical protein A2307_00360 [Candidatus Peregrinibacteria bacterium RIFOXYB2_FULL_33_20]
MNFLNFTINLALQAGKILQKYYGTDLKIQTKSSYRDMVTQADKESEVLIEKLIKENFPNHRILGEESTPNSQPKTQSSSYRWIIDPLDGTANFTKNIPFFAVSIGLEKAQKMIIGIVYNPILNQMFFAEKGSGAYLAWDKNKPLKTIKNVQKNAKKMHVSETKTVKNSMMSTGFIPSNETHLEENLQLFARLSKNAKALRRMGAAALDLCFVAAGWFDGFWEYDLCPWDVAAGSLIIQEAGGNVTNFDGSKFDLNLGKILATNGKIHKEMIKTLKLS